MKHVYLGLLAQFIHDWDTVTVTFSRVLDKEYLHGYDWDTVTVTAKSMTEHLHGNDWDTVTVTAKSMTEHLHGNDWATVTVTAKSMTEHLHGNDWATVTVSGVTYSRVLDKDFLVADKQCLQRFDDSSQVLVILVVVVHVHGIQHIMHGHHPVLKTTATPQCKLFVPCSHPEVNSNT